MAQRLATNYAKAYFTMNEEELNRFVSLFTNEHISVEVKICENGDRDVLLTDKSGAIQLTFHRLGNRYSCESSYLIRDMHLANAMRKAMKTFRGHGIVHRIYDGFTVVYHYDEGSVVSIQEVSGDEEVSIFENTAPHAAKELEELFRQTGSECEIDSIRQETDRWLDLRNWAKHAAPEKLGMIDLRLCALSRRLFELEA
ncbi:MULTISPECIES: hypothetical protein [Brevibacillus]|jgi:hypothetical protein|uniref:Uncharacterized protein n=1 Tax=Brevibacillus borstelensis AK1 TaxID=1300222 RepID=M8E5J6_9BACL|nr:hypothetical protein [Brevibacillus borstelensis]EMT54546.1 hypothetical protein I532_03040 [Brevibacillus borstelensis AK1]KKX54352.1 hypothetical protein X546_15090 [Brevibacillus borstelensis cifa_chp40]MBE5395943.1 hypothetical protein [Brevibacillus borstelensis]MCC0563235.1 hypothetical protein [Brevibacillus borstelensis]MCM3471292.1 hypothetical protein [Brevibacillus borstelensis]